ncbi:hypothetical protein GCM10027422_20130 [Hymenobacter arcticus]
MRVAEVAGWSMSKEEKGNARAGIPVGKGLTTKAARWPKNRTVARHKPLAYSSKSIVTSAVVGRAWQVST